MRNMKTVVGKNVWYSTEDKGSSGLPLCSGIGQRRKGQPKSQI